MTQDHQKPTKFQEAQMSKSDLYPVPEEWNKKQTGL